MKKKQKIILYGIGFFGKKIIRAIDESHGLLYEIVAYMDKKGEQYLNHEIVRPEKVRDYNYDYIAITSEKYYENIRKELVESYSVEPTRIISWKKLAEGDNYYCNICNKPASFFLPSGEDCKIFKSKKVVGGGERKSSLCPFCGSLDRFRWLQYVLEKKTDIYVKGGKILHFAPEAQIADKLRKKNPDYISADIEEGTADVIEDITKLSFGDGTFDYIIFNHVLEHIKEEDKALQEVKRCIKPTGKIILSVPICWDEVTFESDDVLTEQERQEYYGQSDHVRLYGYDFEERIKKYGFEVQSYSYHEKQSDEIINKMSMVENDTIWILSKGMEA